MDNTCILGVELVLVITMFPVESVSSLGRGREVSKGLDECVSKQCYGFMIAQR